VLWPDLLTLGGAIDLAWWICVRWLLQMQWNLLCCRILTAVNRTSEDVT